MKVTLINSRHSDSVVMPLGVLYLASVLEEAGHQVQVFDPFFEDRSFIKEVEDFKPDLIGLSILTATYDTAKKIAQLFRKKLPGTLICAGGVHPTVLPKRTLKELKLDFVVVGEGERTIREVCERLEAGQSLRGVKGVIYQKGQKVIKNPPRELIEDLDELPIINRDFLKVENYLIPPGYIRSHLMARVLTIYSSRGCPAACTFCSSHLLFGRKNRRRSVENVIKEIRQLKEKYQINGFYFMDDTSTLDQNWMIRFSQEIEKADLGLVWGCQTRVGAVDERLLRAMKQAGCVQVDFGVESGSSQVLKTLRKGQTPATIRETFRLAKKAKMRTFATLIVGSPGEKEADIQKTEKLVKEIAPHYTHICFCTPLPGTELYRQAVKKGWIAPAFGNRWDFVKSDLPAMSAYFSPGELVAIRSRLYNSLFWRNYRYVFYPRNLPFLLEAVWVALRNRKEFFPILKRFLKTKNSDDLVQFGLYNYRRQKIIPKQAHQSSPFFLSDQNKNYQLDSKQFSQVQEKQFYWLTQNPYIIRKERELLKPLLKAKPQKILEVGCGEGANLVNLKKFGFQGKMTGIDYSRAKINFAKKKISHADLRQANAYELPFGKSQFDLVFCKNLLHHLVRPEEAIKEMARVCRAGGKVVILEGNGRNLIAIIFALLFPSERGMLKSSRERVRGLVKTELSLKIKKISLIGAFHLFRTVYHYRYGWPKLAGKGIWGHKTDQLLGRILSDSQRNLILIEAEKRAQTENVKH